MTNHVSIKIDTPSDPPQWALLQRALLQFQTQAFEQFYEKYFDDQGFLECVPRWGALDGPDDAIENLANWPIIYLLGGGDSILDMSKSAQDGHIKQYTEAKTVEVPFTQDGMYYKEFPVHSDWAHHAEGLVVFNLLGLCDPKDENHIRRAKRFAGFYMDEDPQAKNYDPDLRLIRSMFNGSRGPILRKTTALDWAGDRLEDGRFDLLHGQETYAEMYERFETYNDVAGDHPLNLTCTGLAFNAYVLTGEKKYRDWILEYADAWIERTYSNGGVIPSNVGLDGVIGSACEGKWWGGVYGWDHTIRARRHGRMDSFTLNAVSHAVDGFGNALLLSGDQKYVDVRRTVLEKVNSNHKTIDGITMYPHMHGDDGWYDYHPEPYNKGAIEVYDWSMNSDDRALSGDNPWLKFLEGNNPSFPVEALLQDLTQVREQVEKIRNDISTPETRLSDNPNPHNPARVENLVNMITGGTKPGYARPMHCRLWYYDADRGRPGLPEDVAALIHRIDSKGLDVQLVNINPGQPRNVIIQGGAYGEHQVLELTYNNQKISVDNSDFVVQLEPGCGARLTLDLKRYVNLPTARFPWDRN